MYIFNKRHLYLLNNYFFLVEGEDIKHSIEESTSLIKLQDLITSANALTITNALHHIYLHTFT